MTNKTNNTIETRRPSKEERLEALKTVPAKRLLDVVFEVDAPDGPGTKREEYPCLRITDYYAKVDKPYNPFDRVTIADFVALGRDYARRMLAGVESTDVTDDGKTFSWYSSEKYAPCIMFEVDDDALMRNDEYGWLLTPVNHGSAHHVMPRLNFATNGVNDDALVAWGKYRSEKVLHATTVADATDVLLIVPWGGAHSQTRGRDAQEANPPGVRHFEKTISKKGGQGYDFYVLDIDQFDARDALSTTERELDQWYIKQAIACHAKSITIRRLRRDYDDFEKCLDRANDKLLELDKKVHECPVAQQAYVKTPELREGFDMEMPKEPPVTTNVALDDLSEYDISDEEWRRAKTLVARSEIIVAAWLEFAPRYNRLYEQVTQACHGWMEIGEDYTRIWLPNNATTDGTLTHEYTFAFSEAHLQACRNLIANFVASEESLKKSNDSALCSK